MKLKPEHVVAYEEVCDLLAKNEHAGVSAEQLLAIAANVVGKLMALQDRREVTPEEAMAIVLMNIEAGNKEAVDGLSAAGAAQQ
jgi:hypothetical protein